MNATDLIGFLSSWIGLFVSAVTIAGAGFAVYRAGRKRGLALAKGNEERQVLKARLERIYAPLRSLLLNVHITRVSSSRYPYFKQRWKRFLDAPAGTRLRRRMRLLKDRDTSWGVEVEFGDPFPLAEITKIAQENAAVADATLLDLIQSCQRERYEGRETGSEPTLRKVEFKLAQHIWEQYDHLRTLFG